MPEPRLRRLLRPQLVLRDRPPGWLRGTGLTSLSLVVALGLGALLLLATGVDPIGAYLAILDAAFLGGPFALADTATRATPLIITGLACALAFRAQLWNVGAEGQLLVGAWAATGVASFWLPPDAPSWLMLAAMAGAAFAAGAAYGAVPGVLRGRLGTSEILTSLMLVYVAVEWNKYWIYSPWSDRGFQMTPVFPESAWLPTLAGLLGENGPDLRGSQAHLGLLLALVVAAVLWIVMKRTRFGFELNLMGSSPRTAEYTGVAVARRTALVLALSGGIAGLAGMVEVSGVVHRLQESFSPGYGFTGILIAWLARLHPAGIVLASFLFGGLLVGAKEVQPGGVATMLQGVVLLTLIAFELSFRYQLVFRAGARAEEDA